MKKFSNPSAMGKLLKGLGGMGGMGGGMPGMGGMGGAQGGGGPLFGGQNSGMKTVNDDPIAKLMKKKNKK